MSWLPILFAVSPVVVIFVLIALARRAADTAGVLGWIFTLDVSILYFETSPIAMLTKLHLDTAEVAEKIRTVGLLWAAASGIGSGLASVISPAKLQNAAAIIDAIGDESIVLARPFSYPWRSPHYAP